MRRNALFRSSASHRRFSANGVSFVQRDVFPFTVLAPKGGARTDPDLAVRAITSHYEKAEPIDVLLENQIKRSSMLEMSSKWDQVTRLSRSSGSSRSRARDKV
jgi:hypothetical protein